MNVKLCHEAIYFLTFIDGYSGYGNVYLLSHCYEGLDVFKYFVAEVKTSSNKKVRLFELIVIVNIAHTCLRSFVTKRYTKATYGT